MKNKLAKAITSIDHNVNKIKSFTFHGKTAGVQESKRTTQGEKFPAIHTMTQIISNEDDEEIDKVIEKKLKKSSELRDRLYREKKEMTSHQSKDNV